MQARPEPKIYLTAWVDAQTARLIDDFARREDRTRASALRCIIRAGVAQMIRGGVAPTGAESAQDAPDSDGGMDAPGDGPDAPQRAAGGTETGIYHTPQAALDVVRAAQGSAADAATGRPLDVMLANPPM